MDLRDTISAELPPPRDDEPAGLRQDILDELADHLACAYNRELLRGADADQAQRRVLQRFGDPAAVARRLWLDAMRGKIMAQRVLIATCLVVTLASLSLAGLMWQQLIHAQREFAAAEAQAIQQEMLKQLREMSEVVRGTRSLDWNPVRFQLTEETPEGPPAVGFLVALQEQVAGGGDGRRQWAPQPTQRVTDGSGVADFGVVRPGDYFFQIIKDWDDGSLGTSGQLHIEPGSQINKRIVCPKAPPERVPVRVRWAWPADLEKEKLVLYATFTINSIRRNDLSWTLSDEPPPNPKPSSEPGWHRMHRMRFMEYRWPATRSILCGPAASMAQFPPLKQPYVWKNPGFPLRELWAEFQTSDLREIKQPAETMEWERGTYQLSEVVVLRPMESTEGQAGRRRFEVIVVSRSSSGAGRMSMTWVYNSPPTDAPADGPRAKEGAHTKDARKKVQGGSALWQLVNRGIQGEADLVLPAESWSKTATSFEARPGQVNEWTIPLPDELIQTVRERLKK